MGVENSMHKMCSAIILIEFQFVKIDFSDIVEYQSMKNWFYILVI